MKTTVKTKKLTLAALLTATAVAGSLISFPVFGSSCAPVQHMVNVLCAITLGPAYGIASAFAASILRNILSLGTLMAFPGSIFGAALSALAYRRTKSIWCAVLGEVFGTAVIGGLCAYPVSIFLIGNSAGSIAFYTYIIPFFISTSVGSAAAGLLAAVLNRTGILNSLKESPDSTASERN